MKKYGTKVVDFIVEIIHTGTLTLRSPPMPTKRDLIQRWKDPEGQQQAERLFDAIDRQVSREELVEILRGLPLSEDVAPQLDFRGLEFRWGATFMEFDLSGRVSTAPGWAETSGTACS